MTSAGEKSQDPARILLVDDNATNLNVLRETLQGRGYELRMAKSGEQALKIADKIGPDLVLLDIMMPPGIDGYETLERLQAEPQTAETPVIFLSALHDTKDKVKGLDLGAVDFISKPFQGDEVIARVNTHLTIHRLRRELERRNDELEKANARMTRDLEAAARVQQALLPGSLPTTDRARFAWQYHPCDELAGDALHIHRLSRRHASLYIVDVSGHGVSAALLSVTVTRSLTPSTDPSSLVAMGGDEDDVEAILSPAELARRLNKLYYPMESNGRHYFTLIYAVLDLETGLLRYTTAGHPGPIHVRPDAGAEVIRLAALPIGLLPEADFDDHELQLRPGERLYLFSDGLYEESNADDEEFGLERLAEALAAHSGEPLDESIEAVRRRISDWRGDDRFTDDLSILGIEMRPD
ncbi:MAG: fused response regulator/phosphatase [Thermoanaerobaculia bacterium]